MKRCFNVNDYWLERGKLYMQEMRTPREFHRLQERFLVDVLGAGDIRMREVLEIGCGFGRITQLLAETWPETHVMALDLSKEQLANARVRCGNNTRIRFEQFDLYSDLPFPGGKYDTAVAVEVFLHHPSEFVARLVKRLSSVAQTIVNIDWSEKWSGPLPEHVWLHDYAKIFADSGMRCAAFLLPQRVDGKQQRLFVAARELPTGIARLEEQWGPKNCPEGESMPGEIDPWREQLQLATTELLAVIPAESALILVDDGQWGNIRALSDHRVFPFREHNGVYWGPPDSDAEAHDEVARLRKAGAAFIAFAWPSFWWLDHYSEFSRWLRAECSCVLDNERLIIFKLQ